MDLNELAAMVHKTATEHGWHEKPMDMATVVANLHDEVSEAWQEHTHGHSMTEVYRNAAWGGPSPYPLAAIKGGWVATDEEHLPFKPEGIPIEMADVVIRAMDFCVEAGIDLEAMIKLKDAYNQTRSWKHGGKRA